MHYMTAEPRVCIVSSSQAETSEDINQNNLPDMLSDSLQSNTNACNYYNIVKLNSTLSDSSHFYIQLNISSLQSHFNNLYNLFYN